MMHQSQWSQFVMQQMAPPWQLPRVPPMPTAVPPGQASSGSRTLVLQPAATGLGSRLSLLQPYPQAQQPMLTGLGMDPSLLQPYVQNQQQFQPAPAMPPLSRATGQVQPYDGSLLHHFLPDPAVHVQDRFDSLYSSAANMHSTGTGGHAEQPHMPFLLPTAHQQHQQEQQQLAAPDGEGVECPLQPTGRVAGSRQEPAAPVHQQPSPQQQHEQLGLQDSDDHRPRKRRSIDDRDNLPDGLDLLMMVIQQEEEAAASSEASSPHLEEPQRHRHHSPHHASHLDRAAASGCPSYLPASSRKRAFSELLAIAADFPQPDPAHTDLDGLDDAVARAAASMLDADARQALAAALAAAAGKEQTGGQCDEMPQLAAANVPHALPQRSSRRASSRQAAAARQQQSVNGTAQLHTSSSNLQPAARSRPKRAAAVTADLRRVAAEHAAAMAASTGQTSRQQAQKQRQLQQPAAAAPQHQHSDQASSQQHLSGRRRRASAATWTWAAPGPSEHSSDEVCAAADVSQAYGDTALQEQHGDAVYAAATTAAFNRGDAVSGDTHDCCAHAPHYSTPGRSAPAQPQAQRELLHNIPQQQQQQQSMAAVATGPRRSLSKPGGLQREDSTDAALPVLSRWGSGASPPHASSSFAAEPAAGVLSPAAAVKADPGPPLAGLRRSRRSAASAAAAITAFASQQATSPPAVPRQPPAQAAVAAAAKPARLSSGRAAAAAAGAGSSGRGVHVTQGVKKPRGGRPLGAGNRAQIAPRARGGGGEAAYGCRSTLYTGVYKCQRSTVRWRVQFCWASKVLNVGSYNTEDNAARAWNAAAMHFRGPGCWLNPVEPSLPDDGGAAVAAALPQPEGGSKLPERALPAAAAGSGDAAGTQGAAAGP